MSISCATTLGRSVAFFFDHLGVATKSSDMSFGVSLNGGYSDVTFSFWPGTS